MNTNTNNATTVEITAVNGAAVAPEVLAASLEAQQLEATQAAATLHAERQAQLEAARLEAATLKAQREAREQQAAKEAQALADAVAAVAADAPKLKQPEPLHANIDELMSELPSPKRVLVGFLLGVAAAFCTGYGIGMIMSYALAGIATLVGAPFVAFALAVLVWVVGLYACWKVGGYIGGKVFSSVVMPDGLASRSYESVAGWFSSTKDKAVGQLSNARNVVDGAFTGAHVKVAA